MPAIESQASSPQTEELSNDVRVLVHHGSGQSARLQ
jgi:hypothetical protein